MAGVGATQAIRQAILAAWKSATGVIEVVFRNGRDELVSGRMTGNWLKLLPPAQIRHLFYKPAPPRSNQLVMARHIAILAVMDTYKK
jgi:hypothetical protein